MDWKPEFTTLVAAMATYYIIFTKKVWKLYGSDICHAIPNLEDHIDFQQTGVLKS